MRRGNAIAEEASIIAEEAHEFSHDFLGVKRRNVPATMTDLSATHECLKQSLPGIVTEHFVVLPFDFANVRLAKPQARGKTTENLILRRLIQWGIGVGFRLENVKTLNSLKSQNLLFEAIESFNVEAKCAHVFSHSQTNEIGTNIKPSA
jgi:hypothetical protein